MSLSAASPTLLPLPARMVNEYVYCPRLFYFEFVEGVFAHNADTVAGKAQHKRQDTGKGALPQCDAAPGDDAEECIHARSVNLGSERLGVVAKLDLAEVTMATSGGAGAAVRVCPVEYKKGRPREGGDGIELWDADKAQLALQILLLRDNGFLCDEGVLYYRETKQRVPFRMDLATEQWIVQQLEAARECAAGTRPPPLDDSPKCPRCSLVGLCLPDETRLLAPADSVAEDAQLSWDFHDSFEAPSTDNAAQRNPFELPEIHFRALRSGEDVRRLIAPNPDAKALYLNTPGHYVSKKDATLVIKEKGAKVAEFRLLDLHHVALFGPVQLSTAAIQTLCDNEIPLTYFSMGGWFYGMTRGHGLTNVFTRIEQFAVAADPVRALAIARCMVHGKIRNQRTLMMRNHEDPPRPVLSQLRYLANAALHAHSIGSLLGIEGSAAALYFENFEGMLKGEEPDDLGPVNPTRFSFAFHERNRRPPTDPVNALLSLVYSLLVKDCTLAAYAAGFDPYVGFLHQPRHGKPALALDLMEEFRPLVAESVVLTLVNKGIVRPNDFVWAGKACSLNNLARKRVFSAYEQRLSEGVTHPVFGYRICYRRAIELQARLLAKCLTGDIEQYIPFLTR